MSHVANFVLLIPSLSDRDEDSLLPAINESVPVRPRGFVRVDEHAGGPKHMECRVYLLASNYFGLRGMAEALITVPWPSYVEEDLRLVVKEQEDTTFTMYDMTALRKIAAGEEP